MKYVPNAEIVDARTGQPLEEELRNRGVNKREQVELRKAAEEFIDSVEMTPESKDKFEHFREIQTLYEIVYGKAAYSLGYSDGLETGMEKGADGKHTILSVEDMSYMITAYDAIKEINKTLLGKFELHNGDSGALGALKCIFDVIDHGVTTQYRLLNEEDTANAVSILNNDTLTPEKRAKILLGKESE